MPSATPAIAGRCTENESGLASQWLGSRKGLTRSERGDATRVAWRLPAMDIPQYLELVSDLSTRVGRAALGSGRHPVSSHLRRMATKARGAESQMTAAALFIAVGSRAREGEDPETLIVARE
jgi:hypothetical protein